MMFENQISDVGIVKSGVPLGFVIVSVRFLIFINCVPNKLKLGVRFFVDDRVIYKKINNGRYIVVLQDDLDKVGLKKIT